MANLKHISSATITIHLLVRKLGSYLLLLVTTHNHEVTTFQLSKECKSMCVMWGINPQILEGRWQ